MKLFIKTLYLLIFNSIQISSSTSNSFILPPSKFLTEFVHKHHRRSMVFHIPQEMNPKLIKDFYQGDMANE